MKKSIRAEIDPGVASNPDQCDKSYPALSEQSIGLLQNLPIFGGIKSSVIESILELSSLVCKKQGELFFEEGDPGISAFILQSGSASVIKSSQQIEYLIRHVKAGDCFGEMAIIDYLTRSASVKADADACAIEISTSALLEIYRQDLEQFTLIQMNMAREVSRRLRDVSDRLFEYQLSQYPAAGKN